MSASPVRATERPLGRGRGRPLEVGRYRQRQGETVRGGERQGETIRGQGETLRGREIHAAAGRDR